MANVEAQSGQLDKDIGVAVLMQKYNDTMQRIDVEGDKQEPDRALMGALGNALLLIEKKILQLQAGDLSGEPSQPTASKKSAQLPQAKISPPRPENDKSPNHEVWDVFKNF